MDLFGRMFKGKKPEVLFPGIILAVIIVGFSLSVIVLSVVPPIGKDALVHHLAVPKLYLKHGMIYEIPFMYFSYYPMNLDLLYMIPLYFGNDILPKFMHFGFGILCAWLIYYYLWKRTNILYGFLGVVFFLSIPIIIKLSISAYVDLGEIFFSFASLFFILEWLRKGYQLKLIAISSVMCGLALGTKYNGMITLFLLTLFVPFLYSQYNKRTGFMRPVGYGLLFLFISLAVFSPWMIKNYSWTGNPIYPLYNKFFNPPKLVNEIPAPSKKPAVKQNRGFFTYRSIVYGETGLEIVLLPIRIFFQGKDGDPQYFDGKLNPFLLIFPFFLLYPVRRENSDGIKSEIKILLFFAVLFFCFSFFSAVLRIRYIAPIIPPLVILSVFGVKNLLEQSDRARSLFLRRAGKSIVIGLVACYVLINVNYLIEQFEYVKPFSYINGSMSRDEYISRYRPEYPAMKYINSNTDLESRIYFLFIGNRGYYCDRDYLYDTAIMQRLINSEGKPGDIGDSLIKQGISHILIYYDLFDRWLKENFTVEKIELAQKFFMENTTLLFIENGFGVLRINDFD